MADVPRCPSFLELDRHALGASEPTCAAHVQTCERCAAYLDRLRQPVAVPAWAKELALPTSLAAPAARGWRHILQGWRGLVAGGGTVALTALLVVVILAPPALHSFQDEPRTSPKSGVPTVALYVKRGESVALWDGQRALIPGDRLRLKLIPDGFEQVVVATVDRGEARPLYRGAVAPHDEAFLPTSWKLDDSPGPNLLAVVFSQKPLGDAELVAAVREQRRAGGIWTTLLVLPTAGTGSPR
ncbi:MAG: hypothetical protein HY901_17125 [Deltaproteobacteria bacterium]|nr:hypothetical protein [Deltaproteobacteria bacterium]